MGEQLADWDERIGLLLPYQANQGVIAATENPAVKFMHCLPAVHNRETEVGRRLYERRGLEALEVTEEVFESPPRSCSTRRTTGCTRSRPSCWPPPGTSDEDPHLAVGTTATGP
jgi:hypothetical protein